MKYSKDQWVVEEYLRDETNENYLIPEARILLLDPQEEREKRFTKAMLDFYENNWTHKYRANKSKFLEKIRNLFLMKYINEIIRNGGNKLPVETFKDFIFRFFLDRPTLVNNEYSTQILWDLDACEENFKERLNEYKEC